MNKKQNVIAKSLALLTAAALAFGLVACGDDGSSTTGPKVECLDNENCLDDAGSSNSEGAVFSSANQSIPGSSAKDEPSSSDAVNGSSSSGEKIGNSSSSKKPKSGSSEQPESNASAKEYVYLAETPFAADLEVSGDTLFAVFQRYEVADDGFSAIFKDPGLLAMYKLSDGTLLDTITLVTKNPQVVKVVKGDVYVGSQGEYNASWEVEADDNRGIEKVDLKKKKSELWVTGTQLGGGVYMMDVDKASAKAYVAVYRVYQDVPAVEVDLVSKTVTKINGIVDASGSIFYDNMMKRAYIGDRGTIDWNTYESTPMAAYYYSKGKLNALYDVNQGLQPSSIAVAGGEIFVYISDHANAGALYWIEEDEEEGYDLSSFSLSFSTDTKIVAVNNKIIVLDRKGKGSISLVEPYTKRVTWQEAISTENPYDVVAIDKNTAWVVMYNTPEIRKISLTNGSTISSIDTKELSAKVEK